MNNLSDCFDQDFVSYIVNLMIKEETVSLVRSSALGTIIIYVKSANGVNIRIDIFTDKWSLYDGENNFENFNYLVGKKVLNVNLGFVEKFLVCFSDNMTLTVEEEGSNDDLLWMISFNDKWIISKQIGASIQIEPLSSEGREVRSGGSI